ncbi:hypothetical protein [Nocardioides sp. AE5]|uniref:hypothetical protein n=1 Tax=Nocardioides sp. AE5 TaxID=2962573 RepID=UPI0028828CE0|nr:hypothetical protein [Nocardioides sp. AE5]MDT0202126.1 hypothetical protein [Nocardioides sp. AE5]
MSRRGLVIGLAAVVVVVTAVVIAFNRSFDARPTVEVCIAEVGGTKVALTPEQAENAALIAAIGVRRGLPARAVSIALATAFQESKILNIEHGDRDSLGLFQQRPSQGWGSREEVLNPYHATNAFYDALVKVPDYESMRITEAAQRVQRSGHPEAYEKHADAARALASAFTGNSPDGQFHCTFNVRATDSPTELDEDGLTERAAAVRVDLTAAFGDLPLGGFSPDGVDSGHMEGSAHYEGRAIDVFFRPIDEPNRKHGWAVAYYLVAQADRLDIATVIFDDKIWTTRRSAEGWRDYDPGDVEGKPAETVAILEHRDHVHVDVHR